MTWVMEQGQCLLSGQLSDMREGMQLPQRIDLVFNMILPSLIKSESHSGKKTRHFVRGKHSKPVGNEQWKSRWRVNSHVANTRKSIMS